MKENTYNVIDLVKGLPFQDMWEIARKGKVDYKVKKLEGMRMFLLLLSCYLKTDRMSQRYIGEDAQIMVLQNMFGLRHLDGRIAHSSISERLQTISPDFFEKIYYLLQDYYAPIFEDDTDFEIRRVDSTLVAETANKLKEGFVTGINDGRIGNRKQIKYTMVQNDFAVTLAKIFTSVRGTGENGALSRALMDDFMQSDGKPICYLFDRGLDSAELLGRIDDTLEGTRSFFVSRLKLSRKADVIEDLSAYDDVLEDDSVKVMEDSRVTLCSDKKTRPTQYRLVRVMFKKPRPRSCGGHRKKYDTEMRLLTDNFQLSSLQIVALYKKRWNIEVFYKFLKQNLSFAHFLSTSLNGITVVLYMTLITALLIKVFMHFSHLGPKFAIVRMENQIIVWMRNVNCTPGYSSGKDTRKKPPKGRITSSDH